jgi:hypothetical protein
MSRENTARTMMAGSTVGAQTALRMAAGWLALLADQGPSLIRTGLEASSDADADRAERADMRFGEDVLAFARESAEVSWRELRRGLDALDGAIRAEPHGSASAAVRRHRVKR